MRRHITWGLFVALVGCSAGTTARTTQPLTVVVDTGKVMSPPGTQGFGGQGIGVFVEYSAGGHWHVYWACDTTLSSAPCSFTVAITVSDSSISAAQTAQFSGNDAMTSTPGQISATTYTTTQVDSVDFNATPGARLTVDSAVDGLPHDGSIFFFVQDGQVRGSYPGPLTDPLTFEPSSP